MITSFTDTSRASLDQSDNVDYENIPIPGLSESVVREISKANNEPEWMMNHRLKSLEVFYKLSLPKWGPSLHALDLESIYYFAKPQ